MVQPIDQGSILASGRALVPDYAAQALQQALLGIRRQEADTNATQVQIQATEQQREMAQEQAFQAALQEAGEQPTARRFAELMIRFPRFSEAIRRSWETMDESQRRGDFQQMAEVHDAARGGNYDLAARMMEGRIAADRQAGQEPDPMSEAILNGLRSSDPEERQFAVDTLERSVAAIAGPTHYASVYGTFSRDVGEVDGIIYDKRTGQPLFQSPYPRVIPGPDGSFFEVPRVESIPVLGGQTPSGGAAASPAPTPANPAPAQRRGTSTDLGSFDRPAAVALAGRYGDVTSTNRSRGEQAALYDRYRRGQGPLAAPPGRSFHETENGARAIDIRRRRGVSHAQVVAGYRQEGYTLHPDTRDEGSHSHIVIASGPSAAAGGAARVRSRQEYDRLPSGARYVAPDGSVRTKR